MTEIGRPDASPSGSRRVAGLWLLAAATAASFLLVFHNFGTDILPDRRVEVDSSLIRPYSTEKTFAYTYPFDGSEPDRWPSDRSRIRFYEGDKEYPVRLHLPDEVVLVGGGRFSHEPGRIVFSSVENTDPRTNGRSYHFYTPILYTAAIGDAAFLAFLICAGAWYFICRGRSTATASSSGSSKWPLHLSGATALFFIGLYCNTGSMPPYAITSIPYIVPHTGYAYNGDHPHFRVLFDFVDGRDRSVWDHAILLRRILFPVLGWPFMKWMGFNVGGTVASLFYNVAAFVGALVLTRRWVGERAAIFAAWLLALYPGAAYWAGLPYTYSLIVPLSLLLMLALIRLDADRSWRALAVVSVFMGVAYLGYDLAVTFVPASLLMFAWRRRFGAAVASAAIQVVPTVIWLYLLGHVFHQPLQNGNSGIYLSVIAPFLKAADPSWWLHGAIEAPGNGLDIFFGANFIFLPALFLAVLAINPLTSRVRMSAAEFSLLASGLFFFAVLNLAPSDTGGWEMKGTWIARLYQPVFPALVIFMARWWQALPALGTRLRTLIGALFALTAAGDALIVFGPILNNPLGLSGYAFYRFYDHTDSHFVYDENLGELGRRPLGFIKRMKPPPTAEERLAQEKKWLADSQAELIGVRTAERDALKALWQIRSTLKNVGLSAMRARAAKYDQTLKRRVDSGEISGKDSKGLEKAPEYFISPGLGDVLSDPTLDHDFVETPIEAAPVQAADVQRETGIEMNKLSDLQKSILAEQERLSVALKDESTAVSDLNSGK